MFTDHQGLVAMSLNKQLAPATVPELLKWLYSHGDHRAGVTRIYVL